MATTIIDDDLYKNDSESMGIYMPEPEPDEVTLENEEHKLMSSSYPIMDDLLDWLDEQVNYYKSTNAIVIDDKMSDSQIARQVMVNKLVVSALETKYNELEHKFGSYKESVKGESDD